jgi:hypothetical protein
MLQARLRVAERVISLQAEVSHLKGLLPICMYCHKIRDGKDTWHPIDQYLAERTNSHLSHGVCPGCFDEQIQANTWVRGATAGSE